MKQINHSGSGHFVRFSGGWWSCSHLVLPCLSCLSGASSDFLGCVLSCLVSFVFVLRLVFGEVWVCLGCGIGMKGMHLRTRSPQTPSCHLPTARGSPCRRHLVRSPVLRPRCTERTWNCPSSLSRWCGVCWLFLKRMNTQTVWVDCCVGVKIS